MKQQLFEDRYKTQWQSFAATLDRLAQSGRRNDNRASDFPAAYRTVCAHLAIARERQYSSRLIDRLSQLALRGYQQMYRSPRGRWSALLAFISADFPHLVRREARLFWFCAALFYLPLLLMAGVVYSLPELIFSLLDPATVSNIDAMYQPGHRIREERPAQSDVMMFGYYIYNNIGIGFRTFAGGMLFGIGSVFFLLFNGVYIGAIAGYVSERGYFETFYPFIVAHGAFELTAIVLAGVAGLRLGLALLAPGRYTRLQSLRMSARKAIKIVYGVIILLLLAAFIEAFWSSKDHLPLGLRYAVGAGCWFLLIVYLLAAGRRHAA